MYKILSKQSSPPFCRDLRSILNISDTLKKKSPSFRKKEGGKVTQGGDIDIQRYRFRCTHSRTVRRRC